MPHKGNYGKKPSKKDKEISKKKEKVAMKKKNKK